MAGGRKPPHKREQVLVALIECGSIEQAADRCGVSEKTIRTWLKEPAFRDEYRQARRKLLDNAVLLLQRASRRAVRALIRQLRADKPTDVIRAAEAILDRAFRGTEVLDLTEAVEDLGRQLEQLKKGGDRSGEERTARDRATEGGSAAPGSKAGPDDEPGPTVAGS